MPWGQAASELSPPSICPPSPGPQIAPGRQAAVGVGVGILPEDEVGVRVGCGRRRGGGRRFERRLVFGRGQAVAYLVVRVVEGTPIAVGSGGQAVQRIIAIGDQQAVSGNLGGHCRRGVRRGWRCAPRQQAAQEIHKTLPQPRFGGGRRRIGIGRRVGGVLRKFHAVIVTRY